MKIIIDTDNLSELDSTMLAFLASLNGEEAADISEEAESVKATAKKAAPAKAAAAKKAAAPVVEEVEEDLVGGNGPTLADAVERATSMVSAGQSSKVKEALAVVGAKRVSEIPEESVADFLEALDA